MTPTGPNVLYIINTLSQGGAEQQLYYLLKHLRPDARIISLAPGGYWAEPMRALGYEVIELERSGSFDVGRLRTLIRLIRQLKPDIVHIYIDGIPGAYGRAATLLTGHRRTLIGIRNHPIHDERWYTLLRRYLLNRHIRLMVTNSASSRDYLVEHEGISPQRARYIPNGMEIERFEPNSSPERKAILPPEWHDKVIVGTVGALAERKSPEQFIEVIHRVLGQSDQVKFVHVGDGHLRQKVQNYAHELQVDQHVLFLGSRSDVPCVLQAFDIFLMTSSNEGTPNAAMEAMATGLPCVLTDTGDCRHLVTEGESGYVVPIGDVSALSDRILRLVADPTLRQRLGSTAHEHIQVYDVGQMAGQYEAIYQELMGL